MAVQAMIELGHNAVVRQEQTLEGYTHDWVVFVRGCNRETIELFIEKVVFQLHESFPKPKRVRHEPPYEVRESGYAGFLLPIVIHFRDGECLTLHHDLILKNDQPTHYARQVKLTFPAPTDDFRRLLLRAGGVNVGSVDQDASHSPRQRPSNQGSGGAKSRPQSSGSCALSSSATSGTSAGGKGDRKSKSQSAAPSNGNRSKQATDKKAEKPAVNPVKEQFLNLFGTPIKKSSKSSTTVGNAKPNSKSPDESKKKSSKDLKSGDINTSTDKEKHKSSHSRSKDKKEAKRDSREEQRDKNDRNQDDKKRVRSSSKTNDSAGGKSATKATSESSTKAPKPSVKEESGSKTSQASNKSESSESKQVKYEKPESTDKISPKSISKSEHKSSKEKKKHKKDIKDTSATTHGISDTDSQSKKMQCAESSKIKSKQDVRIKTEVDKSANAQSCSYVTESMSGAVKSSKAEGDHRKEKKSKKRSDEFNSKSSSRSDRAVSSDKQPSVPVKIEALFKSEVRAPISKVDNDGEGSSKKSTDIPNVTVKTEAKRTPTSAKSKSNPTSDVSVKTKKSRKRNSEDSLQESDSASKRSKHSSKVSKSSLDVGATAPTDTVKKGKSSKRAPVDAVAVRVPKSSSKHGTEPVTDTVQSVPGANLSGSLPGSDRTSHPPPSKKKRSSSPSPSSVAPPPPLRVELTSDEDDERREDVERSSAGSCVSSASSSPSHSPLVASGSASKQNPLRRLMDEVSSVSDLSHSEPSSPAAVPTVNTVSPAHAVQQSRSRHRVASSSLSSSTASSRCASDNNESHNAGSGQARSAIQPQFQPATVAKSPAHQQQRPQRDLSIFTTEYLSELQHLQRRIMTSRDSDELSRVFEVISATGQIEENPNYYDFDLCALDRSVVRKLQQCLLMV